MAKSVRPEVWRHFDWLRMNLINFSLKDFVVVVVAAVVVVVVVVANVVFCCCCYCCCRYWCCLWCCFKSFKRFCCCELKKDFNVRLTGDAISKSTIFKTAHLLSKCLRHHLHTPQLKTVFLSPNFLSKLVSLAADMKLV